MLFLRLNAQKHPRHRFSPDCKQSQALQKSHHQACFPSSPAPPKATKMTLVSLVQKSPRSILAGGNSSIKNLTKLPPLVLLLASCSSRYATPRPFSFLLPRLPQQEVFVSWKISKSGACMSMIALAYFLNPVRLLVTKLGQSPIMLPSFAVNPVIL